MSESESIVSRGSDSDVPPSGADDLLPELDVRAVPAREGLPRSYRMRADAHYVDQFESAAQPVIRFLATGQIECRDLPAPDRVGALTRSIAIHGVLQPLMIRKHAGRFSLIGGRKRLAAAMAAGLTAVPCLVREVDSAAATTLAAADNVRVEEAISAAAVERDGLRPLLEALTSDLTAIRTSTSLLRTTRASGALSHRVGVDLIESQAARAEWLVGCILRPFDNSRVVPFGALLQRVCDGFAAHATLANLHLETSVTPAAAVWRVPDEAAAAVIRGALFATLGCLDGVPKPRLEIHADAPHARMLKIEIVQRAVRVAPDLGHVSEPDHSGAAELMPALALRLARMVAAPLGATAELTPLPGLGGVLQISFTTPPAS